MPSPIKPKPRTTDRDRQRAQAQSWAQTELANRHKAEYQALYDHYCEHLGLTPRRRRTRPTAEGVG